MFRIIITYLTSLLIAASAYGDGPYHSFQIDVRAGYVEHDKAEIVPNRLLSVGGVYGKVMIFDCRKHPEWGSGFRLEVSNSDDPASDEFEAVYIGISCSPETGQLTASGQVTTNADESPKYIQIEKKNLSRRVGQIVNFTATYSAKKASMHFGETVVSAEVNFPVKNIRFYGYGIHGLANFYDIELPSS